MIQDLKTLAQSVLNDVADYQPFNYNNGVRTSIYSEKQFTRSTLKLTLKQWAILANGLPLRKNLSLKSKTNTPNSIDATDLYY